MPDHVHMPSDRMLFGQYLLDKRLLDKRVLAYALRTQEKEKVGKNPRMLGAILMNDHQVFENRTELAKALREFDEYKIKMVEIYKEASDITKLDNSLEVYESATAIDIVKMLDFFIMDIGDYDQPDIGRVLNKIQEVQFAIAKHFNDR